MNKNVYLEIMDKAFCSYTEEQISDFFASVKEKGLTEHGFPRLTINLGILICQGRHKELLPLFVEMMDFCCEQMPHVHAANDFSVREIVFGLIKIEESGILPRDITDKWRRSIASLDPWKCYDCIAKSPTQIIGNWSLFNAASEYARIYAKLTTEEQVGDYLELQLSSQLNVLDENGMYMDPHPVPDTQGYVPPMVYDSVPRALFGFLIHFGYNGKLRTRIEKLLESSADLTLKMQSVTGEIPFGGRSAQFIHNECLQAALLEFYASYYMKKGDALIAGQFKRAARASAESAIYWFDAAPMKHNKNRYSIDSFVGCERYAYFDKYMITAASMSYLAYLMADDGIEEANTCPSLSGAYVAQTSDRFHKIFINNGGYFLEIEQEADKHYDASGLGRIHKKGAPPQICLSTPFTAHPAYKIDGVNASGLSICGSIEKGGKWLIGADSKYLIESLEESENSCGAVISCLLDGIQLKENIEANKSGVEITATAEAQTVGVEIPVFEFDGAEHTRIIATKHEITVEYKNSVCKYSTNGSFVCLSQSLCNRNGRYQRYRAIGNGNVSVKIIIE